uniref:Uncharacterized protein n=1 Tax=Strombidium rassoulzadegani TaxID=1082188 RepID=A0A7S3FSS0_9SPIT|mmetsp:Transcript_11351/g.19124  ORF Transcript_11351/g.19124 Transcript_11351/m.19124 type:complete len:157 (+) Transcript_11351:202-672(+)
MKNLKQGIDQVVDANQVFPQNYRATARRESSSNHHSINESDSSSPKRVKVPEERKLTLDPLPPKQLTIKKTRRRNEPVEEEKMQAREPLLIQRSTPATPSLQIPMGVPRQRRMGGQVSDASTRPQAEIKNTIEIRDDLSKLVKNALADLKAQMERK